MSIAQYRGIERYDLCYIHIRNVTLQRAILRQQFLKIPAVHKELVGSADGELFDRHTSKASYRHPILFA